MSISKKKAGIRVRLFNFAEHFKWIQHGSEGAYLSCPRPCDLTCPSVFDLPLMSSHRACNLATPKVHTRSPKTGLYPKVCLSWANMLKYRGSRKEKGPPEFRCWRENDKEIKRDCNNFRNKNDYPIKAQEGTIAIQACRLTIHAHTRVQLLNVKKGEIIKRTNTAL